MSAFDKILDALAEAGMRVQGRSQGPRTVPGASSQGLTLSVRRFSDCAKVHCFAGCETPDVLEAIGLQLRDLYDEPRSTTGQPVYQPRRLTPWEEAWRPRSTNPPPIEHVLDRMLVEQAKERGGVAR